MSDFAVKVVQIVDPVEHHPDADRLSLIKIGGYTCISAKLEDGSHRYSEGDLVVYVPEGAVLPEWLLRRGFWDEKNDKGLLSGTLGDRVKAMRLRGIFSQGILFPVEQRNDFTDYYVVEREDGDGTVVKPGDDVAEFLGITKYQPPIPAELLGDVIALFGTTYKYDFESIQSVTDLFTPGEPVIGTEKLNGTNCQIGYAPGLNNAELFFDGNLYVSQKGLAAQGLSLNNSEDNQAKNIYVQMVHRLLDEGFGERIKAFSEEVGDIVRVYGEIHGPGVQKGYTYGHKGKAFAVFDIQIGQEYLPFSQMVEVAHRLGLKTVPLLYDGPFDLDAIQAYRDGKNTMDGTHIREGIVLKSLNEYRHPYHGRKVGKWVSPAYLLKATGDEFN